jgi:hypothetical protein
LVNVIVEGRKRGVAHRPQEVGAIRRDIIFEGHAGIALDVNAAAITLRTADYGVIQNGIAAVKRSGRPVKYPTVASILTRFCDEHIIERTNMVRIIHEDEGGHTGIAA